MDVMEKVLDMVAEWIKESERIIVFTGPGVSEESGVPDLSGLGEEVEKHQSPVTIGEFRQSRDARIEYWKRIKDTYYILEKAQPNPVHTAIAELEMLGKVECVITQNIDNLHQRAGSKFVLELHGTMNWAVCTMCGKDYPTEEVLSRLEKGEELPACVVCGEDKVRAQTVLPGQPLPSWELRECWMRLRQCDLFISVGSSLTTQPFASFPVIAREAGAKFVVINSTETEIDSYADAALIGSPSRVLPRIMELVRGIIGSA